MHARYMLQRSLVYALAGGQPRRYRRSTRSATPLPPIPRLIQLAPAPRKLTERERALQRQFTVYVPPTQLEKYRPPDAPSSFKTAMRNDIVANQVETIRATAAVQPCIEPIVVESACPTPLQRRASAIVEWAKAVLTARRDRAER